MTKGSVNHKCACLPAGRNEPRTNPRRGFGIGVNENKEYVMITARIPEELEKLIREEAEKAGYVIVEMSTRGGKGFFLEVVLDKEGGITLDECGEFNKKIVLWVDSQGLFGGRYTLEVSSPGLDRELKTDDALSWASGKTVEIIARDPIEGANAVVGRLLGGSFQGSISLKKEDGTVLNMESVKISKIRLRVLM